MENKPTFSQRTRVVEGQILNVQLSLEKLADAFFTVGNEQVASDLQGMANNLRTVQKEIKAIDNEQSEAVFKQSCESSNNIIRTALAMGARSESK